MAWKTSALRCASSVGVCTTRCIGRRQAGILTALVAFLVEGDIAHHSGLGVVHGLAAFWALGSGRSLEWHGCGDCPAEETPLSTLYTSTIHIHTSTPPIPVNVLLVPFPCALSRKITKDNILQHNFKQRYFLMCCNGNENNNDGTLVNIKSYSAAFRHRQHRQEAALRGNLCSGC